MATSYGTATSIRGRDLIETAPHLEYLPDADLSQAGSTVGVGAGNDDVRRCVIPTGR